MVKSCLPGRSKSGGSQPAQAGGMPPGGGSGEARGQPAEVSAQQLCSHPEEAGGLQVSRRG